MILYLHFRVLTFPSKNVRVWFEMICDGGAADFATLTWRVQTLLPSENPNWSSFATQQQIQQAPRFQASSVAVPFQFWGSAKVDATLPDPEGKTQQSLLLGIKTYKKST